MGVLVPGAASAHPFGPPQQIKVAGEGDHEVRVRWLVGGTDDLTLLGVALGVLSQDRVLLDGAVVYEPADGAALAGAPEFADYLTERITVTQDGRPCAGEAGVAGDLASGGADVLFTCPEPVSRVIVTSRMLTDLHPAYRTLARGPDGQKVVYDGTHESAEWTVGTGTGTGTGTGAGTGAGTGSRVASTALPDLFGVADFGDWLLEAVQSPGFVPVALVIAFVAGAAHGLAPGHGKSLAAAYLIGSRGRVRDAAWLGFSVAVMHTVSVLAIAIAWTFFSLSDLVSLERLTTGLQLAAGLTVVAVGLWLLLRHLRRRGHTHGHGHDHTHHHDHDHPTTTRPGLVLLGMSGGLTPSPAAFLLLVTGIFAGRSGFALVLVACFGLGLAAVLFTVGLMALTGRSLVARAAGSRAFMRSATRVAPVLAACGITLVGVGISAAAVAGLPGI
ncbi:hypothetical protein Vqi01_55350 [Micromonospora qiuiae]|uniref:Nickel/cobalt efflux system n=2 Tax=Micromonospora qiuiae TaxID=502268 RepID=A0ABQ4JIE0_9ACTN|nr:hypothetical protein Vqi01_55350 [Micromonospora qiuiae]